MRRASVPRPDAGFVRVGLLVPRLPIFLLAVLFAIFLDLSFDGILIRIDEKVSQIWGPYEGPRGYGMADLLDKLGQTTVAGIPLVITAIAVARKLGSIRPVVISVGGWMAMYGFVGVIKLATMRESPRTGGPELFAGSNLFPSGHTSNIIFMFGLAVALIIRYYMPAAWWRLVLVCLVPAAFVFMSVISIYRHTHWFSDVIAGGLVGATALSCCLRVDTHWSMVRFWVRVRSGRIWGSIVSAVHMLRLAVLAGKRPTAGYLSGPGRVRWSPADLDLTLRSQDDLSFDDRAA